MNAFMTTLLGERERLKAAGKLPGQKQVNDDKPGKQEPPPPLVDQIRAVLAGWPPSHRQKISIETLAPHLRGKYRERAHIRFIGLALRELGYRPVREWRGPDHARRFWVATPADY